MAPSEARRDRPVPVSDRLAPRVAEVSSSSERTPNRRRLPRVRFVVSLVRVVLEGASVFILLVLLWELAVVIYHPPAYLLPTPANVWHDIWDTRLRWPSSIWVTSQEILLGFGLSAVAGIGLGIAIAWARILSRTLLPFLIIFNTLPKVAIAPFFIIYLGYGIFPNVVIAAMIGFFPVVINTATGLSQVDEDWLDLARSLRAPKWKIFLRMRIPNAMPYIISGLKVSSTLAVVGAVIGEFIASQEGLGNLILSTQVTLNTAIGFAALFWISLLGLILYWAIDVSGKLFVPWASPKRVT